MPSNSSHGDYQDSQQGLASVTSASHARYERSDHRFYLLCLGYRGEYGQHGIQSGGTHAARNNTHGTHEVMAHTAVLYDRFMFVSFPVCDGIVVHAMYR
jgi:hypothetical protein